MHTPRTPPFSTHTSGYATFRWPSTPSLDARGAAEGYQVCVLDGAENVAGLALVGAYGLLDAGVPGRRRLTWILLDPSQQGRGLGGAIMRRVLSAARTGGIAVVDVAASHVSEPFFARFGARAVRRTPDGWGPDMHRVDMEIVVGVAERG